MQSNGETNITSYKRYLLGDLPPPESEAIDLQIISDENSEENLLWAESELMEEFLDDALSPAEIQLFKENFLVSPERLAQFRQISLLRNYARKIAAGKDSPVVSELPPMNWLEKLKKFLSLNWRPATAVFTLIIVGLFTVFYLTVNSRTTAEKEFAALNQKDLSDLAELKPLANLSLMSGAFRDSGDVRRLTESGLTERVLFRLVLPVPFNESDKFRAELVKDGKVIFNLGNLPFYNNPNGQEIRLLLPSSSLKKGAYQIKLTKASAPDSVFIYNFAVE